MRIKAQHIPAKEGLDLTCCKFQSMCTYETQYVWKLDPKNVELMGQNIKLEEFLIRELYFRIKMYPSVKDSKGRS